MSRQLGATLAVLAFSTIAAGTANAKECKTDSDCATGFECVLRYVDGASGSGGSTGMSTGGNAGTGAAVGTACVGPDCPVTSPPPEIDVPSTQPADGGGSGPTPPVATIGICQWKTVTCTSKAECPANLDCVKQTLVAPRPTCAPDTKCDTVPTTTETGTCKAVCEVDSDCPSPLICKMQGQSCMGGGSVSSDGTVTTIPTTCTGGHKICTFEPVVCSSDTMCNDANYQCAKVSEYQSCTGSAPTGCPRTKDGTEPACTPTDPEPPVCTSTVVNNCMPREVKCDAGQACPAGWSCFDFANFDTVTIPGWSGSGYGKTCLPDGFVLGIYGYAAGAGVRSSTGNGSDQGGIGLGDPGSGGKGGNNGPVTTGDGTVPPRSGPTPATDGQESAHGSDDSGDATSTKVRGGGCAMGGTQNGSFSLWLTLGLAGLVLRLVRRRR